MAQQGASILTLPQGTSGAPGNSRCCTPLLALPHRVQACSNGGAGSLRQARVWQGSRAQPSPARGTHLDCSPFSLFPTASRLAQMVVQRDSRQARVWQGSRAQPSPASGTHLDCSPFLLFPTGSRFPPMAQQRMALPSCFMIALASSTKLGFTCEGEGGQGLEGVYATRCQVHTQTRLHACTHANQMHTHTHTHKHNHTHAHTHNHARTHTHARTSVPCSTPNSAKPALRAIFMADHPVMGCGMRAG